MTGAELVSEAISYYDNTLATDATNANRRLRVLHAAQMVLDEVYNHKAWPFKHHRLSVTTSAGVAYLPNFPTGAPAAPDPLPPNWFAPDGISYGRLGPEGAVVEVTGQHWTETTLQEITALRSAGNSLMKVFAIGSYTGPQGSVTTWSEATESWEGGLYQLVIPNQNDAVSFYVYYDSAPKLLSDTANEIVAIPGQYHRTVLLAGTIVRMQTAKSDVRIYWEKQYQQGLARMSANEMPLQSRTHQLPLFQRGQW